MEKIVAVQHQGDSLDSYLLIDSSVSQVVVAKA